MQNYGIIDLFQNVSVTRPPEQVVQQIRVLINKGLLKPGDMLPPERLLGEKLGISRGHVREGIKTLELYGIVKSCQGRGTMVTDLGIQTMSGVLANLLKITIDDIMAFADTRILLETHAVRLAAQNRTERDKEGLLEITERMNGIGNNTALWMELDLGLHIKIAEASHNSVLAELIKFMTPNIMGYYRKFFADRIIVTIPIHRKIVGYIISGRSDRAAVLMHRHLMNSRKVFADGLGPQAATKSREKRRRTHNGGKVPFSA
ncbi:MAG: FadR family transcriptional regulator [Planctomycetota bacterium]|jgi:GntR family transcriptional repressor for pyruvate dehydrogenase complex|nr:FadR family transcriptional regulator [Planctomycetota bacterium]